MVRRSKATLARLNNLNPQNPTVEEVLDDKDMHFEDDSDEDFLEHGFFFLDKGQPEEDSDGTDSDDSEEEVDEEELTGLQNEADIEHFNAFLAQEMEGNVKNSLDNVPIVQIQW